MHSTRQSNVPRKTVTAVAVGLLHQNSSHASDGLGAKKFAATRESSPSERNEVGRTGCRTQETARRCAASGTDEETAMTIIAVLLIKSRM
jgi:hypothetical protein